MHAPQLAAHLLAHGFLNKDGVGGHAADNLASASLRVCTHQTMRSYPLHDASTPEPALVVDHTE